MNTFQQWFKTLKAIWNLPNYVVELKKELHQHSTKINVLLQQLKITQTKVKDAKQHIINLTSVNADLNIRGTNHIIVIGKYRGGDYVQTFMIPKQNDFSNYVSDLVRRRKYGEIDRVDAPPTIRAFIKHELY